MSAFNTYTDTLGNAIITGSLALPASQAWVQVVPVVVANWVSSMELRVLCASDSWQFSAPGLLQTQNDAAVPGPNGLWIPFSIVRAEEKIWFRSVDGELSLKWIIEGKSSFGNVT